MRFEIFVGVTICVLIVSIALISRYFPSEYRHCEDVPTIPKKIKCSYDPSSEFPMCLTKCYCVAEEINETLGWVICDSNDYEKVVFISIV